MKVFLLVAGLILTVVSAAEVKPHLEKAYGDLASLLSPHRDSVRRWVTSVIRDKPEPRADYLTCEICVPAVTLLRPIINDVTEDELVRLIAKVCVAFELAGVGVSDICEPTIRSFASPVIYIVKNRPNLKDDDFCGLINPGCKNVTYEYENWPVVIDSDKPDLTLPDFLPADVPTVKILQFTDIHLHLDYVEGSSADCRRPICCRAEDGDAQSEVMRAGPFGHYKCALPIKALEAMFEHAKENHPDAAYIFLTGDYVHSGVWLYSPEENGRHIQAVTSLLNATFPTTPIIPLTGNHEPSPVNMYPPSDLGEAQFSLDWMYEAVGGPFEAWITPEAYTDFKRAGYYTVVPQEGLRLVILNTNLCYIQNFWLPVSPVDPEGQLQWFANTMLEAERAGESVFVIGHIIPGSGSCWPVWSERFDWVIQRFAGIIRGQFYGHSHNEYFTLTYDKVTNDPISTAYVGPSALTDGMNPGYKVYYVDGHSSRVNKTWEIVDHETYILDITASNGANETVWIKEFSAREAYGLETLRPAAYHDLVQRMIVDPDLYEKFNRAYHKSSDNYAACDTASCVSSVLCNTVESNSADRTRCTELERQVQEFWTPSTTPAPETATSSVVSHLIGSGPLILLLLQIFL